MSEPGATVTYTIREVVDRIDTRLEKLENSAARQTTVRWAVLLSVISGPGAALLTWALTHR